MDSGAIENAKNHFAELVKQQMARVERMKAAPDWIDYQALDTIHIGIEGGDGIGPFISRHTRKVLEFLLADEVGSGKVELHDVEGLTIEKRAEVRKAIPDDVLEEIRKYPVHLKGPTTTPRKGDPWPNIESANVAMRKELDLFANVRPVRVPAEGIDWTFFRENTEDSYALGSQGINVDDDLAFDFKVITSQGSERIIRLAFEHARKMGIDRVTAVTKANVVKTTDGKFLQIAEAVAKEYPGISYDDWYIDIMTAKLLDPKRRTQFKVFVMPNLYGDILTDEAAEMQGGVGTAGSANIGKRYAMFEAIHGSAPRMVDEGRANHADPSSLLRAAGMLLDHIGYPDKGKRLKMALDICGQYEKKVVLTGRTDGPSGDDLAAYLNDTISASDLEERWTSYENA